MKKFQVECNYEAMEGIIEKLTLEGFAEECKEAYNGSELTVGKSILAFYGALIRAILGAEVCDTSLEGMTDDEAQKLVQEAWDMFEKTLEAEAFVKTPIDEE